MKLTQSLLAEVLGVITEPWRDYPGIVNRLIREHDQAKESVYKDRKWKQLNDATGQELGKLWGLPVEVEHKPFVDPELDEENHESEGVKCWHTGGVGEGREDGGQELGVSHLKDPFGTSVEILIFTLDNLAGLLGVPREPTIRASLEAEENRLQEGEDVGEHDHCTLSKSDGRSDSEVPSAVEFVEWSDEEVHFAVLLPQLLSLHETVHGKKDDD